MKCKNIFLHTQLERTGNVRRIEHPPSIQLNYTLRLNRRARRERSTNARIFGRKRRCKRRLSRNLRLELFNSICLT